MTSWTKSEPSPTWSIPVTETMYWMWSTIRSTLTLSWLSVRKSGTKLTQRVRTIEQANAFHDTHAGVAVPPGVRL
ncbi:hypothetical protein ACFYMW_10720 [Streptomyces sp. NPDC006692]|uniref:hypothetical protein n=1 Tax=Streptomyces sp. NPDC006692 TaxID=3364758 RepID=UPI0036829A2A